MLFEFKIKQPNTDWDKINFETEDISNYPTACLYAQMLANTNNKDVRMNLCNSKQGHYFRPHTYFESVNKQS